jgi:hypothetical protein
MTSYLYYKIRFVRRNATRELSRKLDFKPGKSRLYRDLQVEPKREPAGIEACAQV